MQYKLQFRSMLFSSLMIATFFTILITGQTPSQPQTAVLNPATAPISYGLIVDGSLSLKEQHASIKEAAKIIIGDSKKDDEIFLVTFTNSNNIEMLQEFTQDKEDLLVALEKGFPNIYYGKSSIIDALYVCADYLLKSTNNRRVLILITDGIEEGSTYKLDQLVARLRTKQIPVFILGAAGLVKEKYGEKVYREAIKLLKELPEQTQGQAIIAYQEQELATKAKEVLNLVRK
ncbi:MAG: VWA domain-containing protein [Acidobacteriota bacterium]